MINTINEVTEKLPECNISENNIRRARPAWDKGNFRVTPPYEVALGHLWYSSRRLYSGRLSRMRGLGARRLGPSDMRHTRRRSTRKLLKRGPPPNHIGLEPVKRISFQRATLRPCKVLSSYGAAEPETVNRVRLTGQGPKG
jgi:hypothetical protein